MSKEKDVGRTLNYYDTKRLESDFRVNPFSNLEDAIKEINEVVKTHKDAIKFLERIKLELIDEQSVALKLKGKDIARVDLLFSNSYYTLKHYPCNETNPWSVFTNENDTDEFLKSFETEEEAMQYIKEKENKNE